MVETIELPDETKIAAAVAKLLEPRLKALEAMARDQAKICDATLEVARSNNTMLGKIYADMQPDEKGDDGKPKPLEELKAFLQRIADGQDGIAGGLEGVPVATVERLWAMLNSPSPDAPQPAGGGAGEAG